MSKWTKTRRDPGRTYIDANKERIRKENLAMIAGFIEEGKSALPKYVEALKIWFPGITPEQLRLKTTRFLDAVTQKQQDDGRVL